MAITLNDYVIYKHTSPSGKSYIGLTKDYLSRNRCHKSGFTGCTAFNSAINKYGWDSFSHEIILDKLNYIAANFFEKLFINVENTIAPNGYNLKGGGSHTPCSEETKRKISEAQKGKQRPNKPWNLGKTASDEAKEKMSVSAINRGYSVNAINSMTKKNIGNKYRLGDVASQETKLKMSESRKGKKMPEGSLSKSWETRRLNKALALGNQYGC